MASPQGQSQVPGEQERRKPYQGGPLWMRERDLFSPKRTNLLFKKRWLILNQIALEYYKTESHSQSPDKV